MFNLFTVKRLFTWRSPENREASDNGFLTCGWLIYAPSFLWGSRCSEETGLEVYHNINLAFFFSLNLLSFSRILKRSKVSVLHQFRFPEKPQSVLLKEFQLFQITRQEMPAMTDGWFSGVICGMAGSYQEAATPNKETTPLIMLNPGENVASHITHVTLGS